MGEWIKPNKTVKFDIELVDFFDPPKPIKRIITKENFKPELDKGVKSVK